MRIMSLCLACILVLPTIAWAKKKDGAVDGLVPRPCVTAAVTSAKHVKRFKLDRGGWLVVNDTTPAERYLLAGGKLLTVSRQCGYPRYYAVCPCFWDDPVVDAPDDIVRVVFEHERDDHLNRLTTWAGVKMDGLFRAIDDFEDRHDRVPAVAEAESLWGTPNGTRASFWQRRGHITYTAIDSLSYRLSFWSLDGELMNHGGPATWDEHPDPEAIEWLESGVPGRQIDSNTRWSAAELVVMLDEIATRRGFTSLTVRDAPDLVDLEPLVVKDLESTQFAPDQVSCLRLALIRFHDAIRHPDLKKRVQDYLDKLK